MLCLTSMERSRLASANCSSSSKPRTRHLLLLCSLAFAQVVFILALHSVWVACIRLDVRSLYITNVYVETLQFTLSK